MHGRISVDLETNCSKQTISIPFLLHDFQTLFLESHCKEMIFTIGPFADQVAVSYIRIIPSTIVVENTIGCLVVVVAADSSGHLHRGSRGGWSRASCCRFRVIVVVVVVMPVRKSNIYFSTIFTAGHIFAAIAGSFYEIGRRASGPELAPSSTSSCHAFAAACASCRQISFFLLR